MCLPVAAATAFIGAASTATKTVTGIIGANKANAANEQAYEEAQVQANRQLTDDYLQLTLRQATEAAASGSRIQNILEEGERLSSKVATRAAEGGVSGASVAAKIQALTLQEGRAIATETRNRQLKEAQLQLQKESAFNRTRASIIAGAPAPVPLPDIVGSVFGFGASIFEGVSGLEEEETSPPIE